MEIKYDKPIQVGFGNWVFLRKNFSGLIASRRDADGNYFIKVWVMKYSKEIEKYL